MAHNGKRPGTVTAAAVILFIVGGWSLLACACAGGSVGIMAAMSEPAGGAKAPDQDPFALARLLPKEVPGYYPMMFALAGIPALFGVGQIAAGIGLLRLNPTARLMTILITIGKLLFAFVGHAYNVFVVMPVQEQFLRENPQFPGGAFGGGIQLVFLAATVAIQITLCFTIILFVSTQAARAAFAGTATPPPPEADGPPPRRYEGYEDDEPRAPPDTGITDRP